MAIGCDVVVDENRIKIKMLKVGENVGRLLAGRAPPIGALSRIVSSRFNHFEKILSR